MKKSSNKNTKKRLKKKGGILINNKSAINAVPKRKLRLRFWGGAENEEPVSLDDLNISTISQDPNESHEDDELDNISFEGNNNSMHLSELDVPSDFNRTDSADESSEYMFDDSADIDYGDIFTNLNTSANTSADTNMDTNVDTSANTSANTTRESDISGGKKSKESNKTRKSKKSIKKKRKSRKSRKSRKPRKSRKIKN